MVQFWNRFYRGWGKTPKNPLKLWRFLYPWMRWRLAVYRRKGKGKLSKFRYDFEDNWHYRRYSRLAIQTLTVSVFILGTVFGSYATIAGVAKLVRALTQTTTSMPGNIAFNAAGYDTASGSAYVLASEVRLATSSAWWNGSYPYKQPVTLRNLASSTVSTTSAQIQLNTQALIAAGKLQSDCDDLRIVYESTASASRFELPRSLQNCNSVATTITFPLQSSLAIGGTDLHYELYYGNTAAPTPSFPREKYLSFDGVDDYVKFPRQNVWQEESFFAWVFPTAIDKTITGSEEHHNFTIDSSGKLTFVTYGYTSNIQRTTSIHTIPLNTWSYVGYTYSRQTGTKIYINNQADVSNPNHTGEIDYFDLGLTFIGREYPFANRYFKGNIANAAIWRRALTDQEVIEFYDGVIKNNLATGLEYYFLFDEVSGQIVSDSSGKNKHGTLGPTSSVESQDPTWQNKSPLAYALGDKNATLVCPFNGTTTCEGGVTPTTATGALRYSTTSAMSFDGNDNITISSSPSINSTYDEITGEAWIKHRRLAGVSQSDFAGVWRISSSGGAFNMLVYYGYPKCRINNSTEVQSSTSISDGNWHHIACTYDGSLINIWVDGQLRGSGPASGSFIASGNHIFGTENNTFRSGYLDEFRISNSVRYTSNFTPQTSPFQSDENTKLLYHFDENGDDPRNTGKAIDASGNGNHGTIVGAKYVNDSPIAASTYASHNGIFIEEGTTNLITNPSFEHSVFNTNWTPSHFTYATASATFTPNMAKRNSAGPFAAGPMVQGKMTDGTGADSISFLSQSTIATKFSTLMDYNQGSITFSVTPEWNGNDGLVHRFVSNSSFYISKGADNRLHLTGNWNYTMSVDISNWVAGNTYYVVGRWSSDTLDGTNRMAISINDVHVFGETRVNSMTPVTQFNVGSNASGAEAANAIIEGLTVYRRVLYDGTYGTDVGNGDEINQIYNGGTGKDPTLVTGSWDVVFALPTNATTGTLATGTGNAWSMPHSSNLLGGTNGKNGFMMSSDIATDGWSGYENKLTNSTFDTDLTGWTGTQSYDLRDEFSDTLAAGSVNGTLATDGVNTRTVVDTTNKITIGSNILNFASGGVNSSDPALYYNQVSRSVGKILSFDYSENTSFKDTKAGFFTNTGGSLQNGIYFRGQNGLYTPSTVKISEGYNGTTYKGAVVLKESGAYYFIKGGNYPQWTLLYIDTSGNSSSLYPGYISGTYPITSDFMHISTSSFLPTPLAYDTFTTNGATQTEAVGPDGQTTPQLSWSGGSKSGGGYTIFPTQGTELITNGTFDTDSAWTKGEGWSINGGKATKTATGSFSSIGQVITPPISGTKYQIVFTISDRTAGAIEVWMGGTYQNISPQSNGTFYITKTSTGTTPVDIRFNGHGTFIGSIDNVSVTPFTSSSLFSSVSTTDNNVIMDANVTMTAGTQAGLVLNLDSVSNPQNFVIAYHDGTNVKLEKNVGGTYTTVQTTAVAYSAGAPLRVIKDGTKYRVYYNYAMVGSEQTISDAGIINNTTHGLFSTYSGNSFDNFSIFARGTDGEYNSIPAEDLTVTRDTGIKYLGTGSAKLVAAGNDANFLQSVNVGDTNPYTITAYAYTDGGAVTTADANLYYNTGEVETTFTSVGSGWYKLTGIITGVAESKSVGVRVRAGKTVYVDSISVNPNSNLTQVTNSETAQKIFSGGYAVTSNQWEGIYKDITVTPGKDVVLRGIGHSDGTSTPRIVIYDQTNGADIGALNGTTTSTRAHPDVLLFTAEAPAGCTTLRIKLVNASATAATTYWHQVEVYNNHITNPSMESGSGDPWIPIGWLAGSVIGGPSAGQAMEEASIVHSGLKSLKMTNGVVSLVGVSQSLTNTFGLFYGVGMWAHSGLAMTGLNNSNLTAQTVANGRVYANQNTGASWQHLKSVGRVGGGPRLVCEGTSVLGYCDDAYAVPLDSVSLTVTPASSANSTETSGIRVDGADTLTQPVTGLSATNGVIKFKFTPRHTFSVADKFGISNPLIFQLYFPGGWSGNSFYLYKSGTSQYRIESFFNGQAANIISNSPTLNANTTYQFEISYNTGGYLSWKINGIEVGSAALNSSAYFSVMPTLAYFGSNTSGESQYDATYSSFVTASTTENTTAPYYKFGSKSVKIQAYDAADQYVTPITTSTNSRQTISAYVYSATTGNVGGTIDNTIATLASGSASITPTYTDMGGGWWRLSYTDPASIPANTYKWGVEVKPGKTVYVDGVQVEQKTYPTSYTDGSLGTGYSWSGTANESSSTRVIETIYYPTSGHITQNRGTISFWVKSNPYQNIWNDSKSYSFVTTSGGNNGIHITKSYNNNVYMTIYDNSTNTSVSSSTAAFAQDRWHHIVGTWDFSGNQYLYVNGTSVGTPLPTRAFTLQSSIIMGNFSAYPSNSTISDFRIFDQPLTATEIAQLYQSGLQTHSNGAESDDRYNPTGTYTSPVMDLGANGQWADTPWSSNQTLNGGTINYFTRTSADNQSWSDWLPAIGGSITSDPRRYFQWKANLTANAETSETPVISGLDLTYVEDSTEPENPSATALGYSDNATASANLTSGNWHKYPAPKFTWEEGVDTAGFNQSSSGIDGYYLLLTKTADLTPTQHTDDPCYQWHESDARSYQTSCTLTDGKYYLRLQTKDNSGNISNPVTIFEYWYDGTSPVSPTSVSSTTVGYTSQNSFTFYWPAATDSGGSGVAGYEYKTGAIDGTFSTWQFSADTQVDDITAYQEGQNFFFVRTIDTAGNVSAETSNAAVGISPFYFNESAPSAPENVVITPASTATTPADSNIFDVTWDKPATYSGEISKYYYCVNCTPSQFTMAETTAAETVGRVLTQVALASQQGKNTFYVVAEDNNIGPDGHGNRNFEAYTAVDFYASTIAPAAPENVTISDISDRDESLWRLTLAWKTPSSGGIPIRYDVYRLTAGETSYTKVGSTTATAYTDADLTQGIAYAYYVKAIDNAGSSSLASNTVSKAPEGRYTTPPTTGGIPSISPGSTTAIVSWTTSRSAYGTVEYGKTDSLGSATTSPTAGNTHAVKITGLAPGTTYSYRVQSLDEGELMGYERTAAYSTIYTFTTLSTPEIGNIQVTDIDLDSALVSWQTTSLASSVVEYGETTTYGSQVTVSSVASTSAHMAKLVNLKHSTAYHFRVRGVTSDGNDIFSEDNNLATRLFPKVTAMVFNTDQGASGTSIMVGWSTNVPTTATVEYQKVKVENEGLGEELLETTQGGEKKVILSKLQTLSQAELAQLIVTPQGESQQLYNGKLDQRHVMRLSGLEDGMMYVITLRGRDQFGLEAVSEPWRYVTGADTRPPQLSNMVVETPLTGIGTSAKGQLIVSWETDEPAAGQLIWGEGTGSEYPQASEKESSFGTKHVIVIRDLEPTQTYHFKLQASDSSGNTTESEDTVIVTPATQQAALDIIFKNLDDIFGFLKL